MRSISVCLAAVGLATGLIAAWYWYLSAKEKLDYDSGIKDGTPPPAKISQDAWESLRVEMAFARVLLVASKLSAKAAIWTAVSVTSGALSSIVGAFS